jgi:hypothetical protein
MQSLIGRLRTGVPLLFVLILMAVLSRYSASGVLTPDFYTHLVNGEWIITHLALPAGDFYSWSKPGTPYRLHQWGGETIMAALWLVGGGWATKLAAGVVALASTFLVYSAARIGFEDRSGAALTTVAMIGGAVIATTAEPRMFSLLGFAAVVLLAGRWKERRVPAYLIAIPLVFMAWANLDSSFPLGIIYLAVVALGLTAERYVIGLQGWAMEMAAPVAIAAAAAALATFANPYGARAWMPMLDGTLFSGAAMRMLPGTAPPSFTDPEGLLLLAGVCFTVAAAGFSRRRMRIEEIVIFALFLPVGAMARDNVPYFLIAITPIVARHVAETTFADAMLPSLRKDMALSSQILAVALAIPVAMTASYMLRTKGESEFRQAFAVDALRFIITNNLTSRLMHDYSLGGYFAYAGGVRVFTDARPSLYGRSFLDALQSASEARPGYLGYYLEQWNPGAILMPADAPARAALQQQGRFAVVFETPRHAVLVRRGNGHDDLIASVERHDIGQVGGVGSSYGSQAWR